MRSTATVKSVLSFNVGAIGIGLIKPPSTRILPLYLTGVNIVSESQLTP